MIICIPSFEVEFIIYLYIISWTYILLNCSILIKLQITLIHNDKGHHGNLTCTVKTQLLMPAYSVQCKQAKHVTGCEEALNKVTRTGFRCIQDQL